MYWSLDSVFKRILRLPAVWPTVRCLRGGGHLPVSGPSLLALCVVWGAPAGFLTLRLASVQEVNSAPRDMDAQAPQRWRGASAGAYFCPLAAPLTFPRAEYLQVPRLKTVGNTLWLTTLFFYRYLLILIFLLLFLEFRLDDCWILSSMLFSYYSFMHTHAYTYIFDVVEFWCHCLILPINLFSLPLSIANRQFIHFLIFITIVYVEMRSGNPAEWCNYKVKNKSEPSILQAALEILTSSFVCFLKINFFSFIKV